MRLLNTSTLEFKEIYDPTHYNYLILSHRWGDQEVSFEDFVLSQQPYDLLPPWQVSHARQTRLKTGYDKIIRFCAFAQARDYQWCWIDTCCIDKRSSAELSEAINSMWKWYEVADECCVYLVDVSPFASGFADQVYAQFKASRWFRRCWTLQELLAPSKVMFCTQAWEIFQELRKGPYERSLMDNEMFDRHTLTLTHLETITGIPKAYLDHDLSIAHASVAQKMSWAANRSASRVEDESYSLLGLFDINMPLLYGEGRKAFKRLQHEIIRQSPDESVFAWKDDSLRRHSSCSEGCLVSCSWNSLLAPHPKHFASSGRVRFEPTPRSPYAISNQGLDIVCDCQIVECDVRSMSRLIHIVRLNCDEELDNGELRQCKIALLGGRSDKNLAFKGHIESRLHCCDFGKKLDRLYPHDGSVSLQRERLYAPVH